MTSRELTEWQAFAQLEPLPEARADLRAALLSAVIANRHRGRNEQAHKVAEFLLDFEDRPAPSDDELLSKMEAIVAALGGNNTDGHDQQTPSPTGDGREGVHDGAVE